MHTIVKMSHDELASDLADRMESVAREAREVGAALSGARSGAAEEGAQA